MSMANHGNPSGGRWTNREAYLLALACLIAGLLVGYILRGSSQGPGGSDGIAPTGGAAPSSPATMPTSESLQPLVEPLLAALKVDPKNVDTLVQLGNHYYDHHIYPQAIEYYTRALEVRPNDINVRTDLGTAFWYSGSPEKAIVEYQKSLALDPSHANTLFNLGIVRSEGLKDYAGAITAWEQLLKANPEYPQRQHVLDLIEKARGQRK